MVSQEAAGDEFKLTPAIAVKEEYNDNILYWTSDTQHGFITTTSPELNITDKTERMETNFSGRLDQRFYSSHGELNATDQFYEGSGRYALTPRLNLSGKVFYSQDSNPDRDLNVTGLALTNVQRARQNYTASGDYLLSEKTMTTFSYDYLKDNYDSPTYTDLEANTMGLGFIHNLSRFMQSTKARGNIVYANYNMTGAQIDNYEATIGINRALNEKWNLLLDGGARYTDTKISVHVPVDAEEKSQGWGAIGQLALTYAGEVSNASITIKHDILPASGNTGASERTSSSFSANRKFTYELSSGLSGGYFVNKASSGELSATKIDEESIWISPSVRYKLTKDAYVEASYAYNKTWYHVTQETAERNLFQLRLRVQYDVFH
jgi:hypothetical protein